MQAGELFGEILEVEHAWLGTPHASPSVKRVGGVEVARNLVTNPSFEVNASGLVGSSFLDTDRRTNAISRVATGNWAAWPSATEDADSLSYVYQDITGLTGGDWVAQKLALYATSGAAGSARLRISFGGGGPRLYESLTPITDVRGGVHWLEGSIQVPDGYTTAQMMLYFYTPAGGNLTQGSAYATDAWMFATANTEHAALEQVATYFDGDTPNVYRTPDHTVRQYTSRILVNGVEREADAWSVDRELQGDLPKQVAAVSGVTQATGKIDWTPEHVVSEHSPNPWNRNGGWVPSRGDRVEIFVSDGVTEWKRFHGLIDITRGDVGSGFTSTIIDNYDKLSAPVSHIAMTAIMPPPIPGGEGTWRQVGLHPLYYIDRALRQAGFYVTPPREQNSLLYVPLQGSLWPHYGLLEETQDTLSYGGVNRVAPWGLGKGNFTAFYTPRSTPTMNDTVQMSFMVAPDHASATDLFLDYGSTDALRVTVSSTRVVTVRRGSTTVASLSLQDTDLIVSVLFKNRQATIRTNTGREASGGFSIGGSGLSQVRVNAGSDASIAGFQVSQPEGAAREHISTRATLNARFDTTSLRLAGSMPAAPNIEGVTAANLIEQINDSIIAALWIDETGRMQWAQSDTLRRRSPVKTVTTAEDIFSLSWESGLLQSASRVTVAGKQPAITQSRWRTTTVAENSGSETLRSGDELEIFFEPGSDEDWIIPSFQFTEVGGESGIWGSFNFSEYGMVGLYFERDGEEITGPVNYRTTITTHRLGNQKTLIKYVAGNWPSDVEGVLKTPPEDVTTTLWPRHRNQPVVRQKAFGKIEWYDDQVSITGVGGPGPEFVHDVGVWSAASLIGGEGTNYWERIGDYIQSQVTVPQPVVRGVNIAPDPRLQLADVITIHSDLLGVELRSLITGFSESFDGSGYHQNVDVRVLDAETTSLTYKAYQEQLSSSNLTYEQWQALGPLPQTYTEFNEEGA